MTYPYDQRDLVAAPESYMYSQVQGVPFLHAWSEARRRTIVSLQAAVALDAEDSDVVASAFLAEVAGSAVDANAFGRLVVLCAGELGGPSRDESVDHRRGVVTLLKRFEVTKRVHSAFEPGTWRPVRGSRSDDVRLYALLAGIVAGHARAAENLVPLNCLLKLTDVVSSVPPRSFDRLSALAGLYAVIVETHLVDDLSRRQRVRW